MSYKFVRTMILKMVFYLNCVLSFQILRYLLIRWKSETGLSKDALLEGQLTISIEALSSRHLPNSLHCAITSK